MSSDIFPNPSLRGGGKTGKPQLPSGMVGVTERFETMRNPRNFVALALLFNSGCAFSAADEPCGPTADTVESTNDTMTSTDTKVVPVNECTTNNGGCSVNATCIDTVGSYTCICKEGYIGNGVTCIDVNDCSPNPCLNGGVCTDGVDSYTCECEDGFVGDDCKVNIDDCSPNPCLNGGTCTDGVNEYTCDCPLGVYGFNCQYKAEGTFKVMVTSPQPSEVHLYFGPEENAQSPYLPSPFDADLDKALLCVWGFEVDLRVAYDIDHTMPWYNDPSQGTPSFNGVRVFVDDREMNWGNPVSHPWEGGGNIYISKEMLGCP